MATLELKENEYKEFRNNDYAVIDCYGDFCAACVMLEPVFDGVANELSAIYFGRVNITHYPEIADEYGIDAMPTLLFFRKGRLVNKFIGSMEREQLLELVSGLLYGKEDFNE